MKEQSLSINLFLKKRKDEKKSDNRQSIIMRLTVHGVPKDYSINRKIEPEKWNQDKQKAIGKGPEVIEVNNQIDSVKSRIYKFQRKCDDNEFYYTAQSIIDHLRGKDVVKPKSYFELFEEHNSRYEKLVGIDHTKITWERYVRTLTYLKEFCSIKYNKQDLLVTELTPDLINEFEVYLKTVKGCQDNAAKRHQKNMKKVVVNGIANNYMSNNPFSHKKLGEKAAKRDFLTKIELKRIISKNIDIPRLEVVRDAFVFCCFTGVAYSDLSTLTTRDISPDENGNLWIDKERTKTKVDYTVPLMPVPRFIINKYNEHPRRKSHNILIPVPTNQHMNSYLKEIADICHIHKNITTHMARHTFATLALENKVAIQNVSKMLGHASLKLTEHYAQTQRQNILSDMLNAKDNIIDITSLGSL